MSKFAWIRTDRGTNHGANYLKNTAFTLLILSIAGWSPSIFAQDPKAGINIHVGEAKIAKPLFALPPLTYLGAPTTAPGYQSTGAELFQTLVNDLTVSAVFSLIDQKAMDVDNKSALVPITESPTGFKFQYWQQIKADYLVRAGYSIIKDSLTFETYLYDVKKAKLLLGKKYTGSVKTARTMAHTYANDILNAVTGNPGMFLSQFVFTSDRAGGEAREVFTMDWDGANIKKLTDLKTITLSPAWAPSLNEVAFTAFVKKKGIPGKNPDLIVHNLNTGKNRLVSFREGMNSGAAFDPDGKHIYLTISYGKNPDIHKIDYSGNIINKLTSGPLGALNVEPAISKDGKWLAFSSDRQGAAMIYVMNLQTNEVFRRTERGVYNSSPAWSPDGTKIAFAGQVADHFDIFIMDADGKNLRAVTEAQKKPNGKMASNEDPTFSPDGRFLVYTSDRTGKNQIYISTIDGIEERRITHDQFNYYKPRWSANR